MKKRFLSLLMALCLILTLVPVTALAADDADVWDGTAVDTKWYSESETSFTISRAAELAGLAQLVNGGNNFSGKTITLAANIDLAGKEWTPIGRFLGGKSTSYFAGTFDGAGYTISGLTIRQAADTNDAYTYYGYGLFGAAGAGAAFQDLTIDAPMIQLDQAKNVGALLGGVGYAGASAPVAISNIRVTNAVISANGRVGGLVGWVLDSNKGVSVSDCSVTGSIAAVYNLSKKDDGDKAGGLIGLIASGSSIENSAFSGSVEAYREAAGLVGTFTWGVQGNELTVAECTVSDTEINQVTPDGVEAYDNPSCGALVGKVGSANASHPDTIAVAGNIFTDVEVHASNEQTEDGLGAVNGDTVTTHLEAKIGDQYFPALTNAISEANSTPGQEPVTVEIVKSGSYDPFTITRNKVTVQAAKDVNVTINVSAGKTGNVNGENVTLEGLNFVSTDGTTIFSSGNCDNLTLEACTFTGNGGGTALYIHKPNITIHGCTFTDFERGYYTCGDNHAAGEMTFTGNTFTNVRVPIDGYWGKTATRETNIRITGNKFNSGDWDAAYIQLWDYAQYLKWAGNQDLDRQGSAIKATIEKNTYEGNVVIYATHFNWFYNSTLNLDEASRALLKYRVLVELENAQSATVSKADGSPITAFNETTTSQERSGKTVIYSICEGDYRFDIKPDGSAGDGLVTQEVEVKQPETLGTTSSVSVPQGEEIKVARVRDTEYTSLAEAINAANPGGIVELLANVSIGTWQQVWNTSNLTIKGNNHTITINKVESNVNGNYLFYGAENLSVSNLTVKFIEGGNGFDMTSGKLENVKMYGGANSNYAVFVGASDDPDAKVEISGCTFDNFGIAVYSQPASAGKNTSDLSVDSSAFTGCGMTMCSYAQDTSFTNNTVTGGSEVSFAAGAEKADRENSYTVTGNTFQDAGKIWFYQGDLGKVEFTRNKVLGDTVVSTADAKAETELDISENYWGGGAPSADQLGGTSVTGNNVYYVRDTMNPSDLNTYSGGSGSSTPTYASTVASTTNGSVTVSPKNASKGATVTITVAPNEGYMLDTLTVTDKDGKTVELTKVSDTKYTFKMPGSAVTVKATFAEKPAESKLPFTDVAADAWYYDAVAYVYGNGMMTGTNDGTTFSPAMNLTRGMMAQVMYNIEKGTAGTAGTFTDVAAGAWYADAVNWAASKGIVNGYGDGTFGPEDSITREQMAVLLYNYAKYKGYDMTATADLSAFTDGGQVSGWAEYAMQWAVAEKLIQGSNNALNPLGTASRAEVAQILANFGQNIAK